MTNPTQRIAAIHDLSGFGRASLTVAIPVLSSMGFQVCPMPTAVLSTHTEGYFDYSFLDLTKEMRNFVAHWKRLGLQFDAVYSGFLGSVEQADIVAQCIDELMKDGGLAVVDPVLGDNGIIEPTMNMDMVRRMQWLVAKADVITPNFTEASLLLDEQYTENIDNTTLKQWLMRLADMGPRIVVVTSVPVQGSHDVRAVVAYDKDKDRFWKVTCQYIPAHYPGTGDTFASVLTGSLLQGDSLPIAMDRAVQFVTMGIRATFGHGLPNREGILLEQTLDTLHLPITSSAYEVLGD
ncbi:MAG: pyridoxamine kinase [Pseudomonadota bacterium]